MHGEPVALARAGRPARRPGRWPRCGPSSTRGPRRVQVFDSWAGHPHPAPLRGAGPAGHPPALRRAGRLPPRRPRPSSSAWAPASCSRLMATAGSTVVGVDWRVPLDEARRRVGPGSPSRATSIRPSAWPPGRWPRPRPATSSTGPGPPPATSSTSATGSSPRPTRPSSSGWSSWSTPRAGPGWGGAVVTDVTRRTGRTGRGAGHGPRHPGLARRHRVLLHLHPRRAAARPPSSWPSWSAATRAIGGTSPLTERTRARSTGWPPPSRRGTRAGPWSRYGAKYVAPSIEEGVAALVAAGVDRVVGHRAHPPPVVARIGRVPPPGRPRPIGRSVRPLEFIPVPSWHRAAGLRRPAGRRTRGRARRPRPRTARPRTAVFFTAHSLPERAVADGDPYPDQVARVGRGHRRPARARRRPRRSSWGVAWQSAGRTADPWLGPDLLAEIGGWPPRGPPRWWSARWGSSPTTSRSSTTSTSRRPDVAPSAGVAFARTASLNDDPALPRHPRRRGARAPVPTARTVPVTARPSRRDATAGGRSSSCGGGIAGLAAAWELVAGRPGAAGAPRSTCSRPATGRAASSARPSSPGAPSTWPPTPSWPGGPRPPSCATSSGSPTSWSPVGAAGCLGLGPGPAPPDARRARPRACPPAGGRWPARGSSRPAESLRAATDLVAPPPRRPAAITGDRSVGEIVGDRLGRPVVDRLVDPLVGGIHAGGVDDLSAAATFPLLLAAALPAGQPHAPARRVPVRGAGHGRRPGDRAPRPLFWSLRWRHGRAWPTDWPTRLGRRGVCALDTPVRGRVPSNGARAGAGRTAGLAGQLGDACGDRTGAVLARGRRRGPGRPRRRGGRAARRRTPRWPPAARAPSSTPRWPWSPCPSRRARSGHRCAAPASSSPGPRPSTAGRPLDHRLHLSRAQVAAPRPARRRADPALGRPVRRRPRTQHSTTTS